MEESIAMAEQYLYQKFLNDSSLWVNDTAYYAFIAEHEEDEVGELYEVEVNTRFASTYDSLYGNLIENALQQIDALADSFYVMEDICSGEEAPEDCDDILMQLISAMGFLDQTVNNLLVQQEALWAWYLEMASLLNEYIVPTELPNQNTQYINSVEFALLEGDTTVLSDEYSDIFDIAQQCPYAGGKAVFRARVILALVNDSIEYDDEGVCLQSGIYRKADESAGISDEASLTLIPNPATEKTEIQWSNMAEGMCSIEIINPLGISLIEEQMDCSKNKFILDVGNLASGLYVVRVYNLAGKTGTARLLVTR